MRRNTIIAIIVGLVLIAGLCIFYNCPLREIATDGTDEEATHVLSAHLKMKKWRNKGCTEDTLECAIVRVQYLQFEDSIRPNIARQLNDTINALMQNALLGFSGENSKIKSVDALAQQFLDDYDEENEIEPTYPWNMEISIDLLSQTLNNVAIEESTSSYTGGAHPNSYVAYHNYSVNSAELLSLEDIVLDQKQLLKVAEKAFRQANNMGEWEAFVEKGFDMDSLFVLTQNFALTKDGLEFLYNPYEIAPYSMGTIEFSIPYSNLENILKPAFLLK